MDWNKIPNNIKSAFEYEPKPEYEREWRYIPSKYNDSDSDDDIKSDIMKYKDNNNDNSSNNKNFACEIQPLTPFNIIWNSMELQNPLKRVTQVGEHYRRIIKRSSADSDSESSSMESDDEIPPLESHFTNNSNNNRSNENDNCISNENNVAKENENKRKSDNMDEDDTIIKVEINGLSIKEFVLSKYRELEMKNKELESNLYCLQEVIKEEEKKYTHQILCLKIDLETTKNRLSINYEKNMRIQEEFKEEIQNKTKEIEGLTELNELLAGDSNYYEQITKAQAIEIEKLTQISELNSNDKMTCVVCLDKPRSYFFESCRHFCCCKDCANKCNVCPICKEKSKPLQLFIP